MTTLADLHWHWPWAFALLLLPLALGLWGLWRGMRQLHYADPALRPWAIAGQGKSGRGPWHALAWLLLVTALAGPRLAAEQAGYARPARQDVQVLVLLDLSASMQALDLSPSRLERARLELDVLPRYLAGESLGLAVFAGRAGMIMPPSSDAEVFRYALAHSDHVLGDAPGTALAPALELARNALGGGDGRHGRAILLVSDGEAEALQDQAVLAAVEGLRAARIPLFILGCGTPEGAPLPDGAGGYLMRDGRIVHSRMDAAGLAGLAERSGGRFIPVTDGDADLRALARAIAGLPSHTDPGQAQAWRELFLIPLLAGLLLLLFAYAPPRPARLGGLLMLPLLLGTMLGAAPKAQAQDGQALAYAAWARGDYVQAQLLYARLPGAQARLGEGAAAYRRGDLDHAIQSFTSAWLLAEETGTRADALYNLGNAELKSGHPQRAALAYEAVLRLRPDDEAAQANLWIARRQAEARQMKKSRPEAPPGHRPTDMARYDEEVGADFPEEDEAFSGSDLSTGVAAGARQGGKPASALALSEADRLAAQKKMELLQDDPAPMWRAMMRAQMPAPASEGPPW